MQIELPEDIVERIHSRFTVGTAVSEVDIIRQALDTLDWIDGECRAIQEGIDAWQSGDVQDFDEFDRQFRAENNITRARPLAATKGIICHSEGASGD